MEIIRIKANRKKNIYEKKLNVCAYVRVSTKLEMQTSSLESQKNYYTQKINKMDKWNFVGVYEDNGISGRSVSKRKGFMRMYYDALDGKIDLILTKSISRFARNTVDSLEYIRNLKRINVGIIFEEEGINSLMTSSEMLIAVFSSIAQMEAENTSQRISYSVKMKKEMNEYYNAAVPYGYRLTPKGKLKVVENEAEVVKRIFSDASNSLNLNKIAINLNNENIKSPTGKKWNSSTIKFMLCNRKYINDGDSKPSRLSSDGYIPIIDEEVFYKVENILNEKSKKRVKDKTEKDYLPFKEKIKCGYCGSNLFRKNVVNGIAYLCTINTCSYNARTREVKVINAFIDLVDHGIQKRTIFTQKIASINNKIKSYRFMIDNYSCFLSNLSIKYLNKKINYRMYSDSIKEISNEINKLNDEVEILVSYKEKIKQVNDIFRKAISTNEFNEKLFNKIVSYILIGRMSNKGPEHYYVRFLYDPNSDRTIKKDIKYFNKGFERIFLISSKQDRVMYDNHKYLLDDSKLLVTYEIRKDLK